MSRLIETVFEKRHELCLICGCEDIESIKKGTRMETYECPECNIYQMVTNGAIEIKYDGGRAFLFKDDDLLRFLVYCDKIRRETNVSFE